MSLSYEEAYECYMDGAATFELLNAATGAVKYVGNQAGRGLANAAAAEQRLKSKALNGIGNKFNKLGDNYGNKAAALSNQANKFAQNASNAFKR